MVLSRLLLISTPLGYSLAQEFKLDGQVDNSLSELPEEVAWSSKDKTSQMEQATINRLNGKLFVNSYVE